MSLSVSVCVSVCVSVEILFSLNHSKHLKIDISMASLGCIKDVTRFQGIFIGGLKVFQGGYKKVPRVIS